MRTIQTPDIATLHCFVLAATHLHFRVAASAAALSATAFSQRIRALEEQLGVTLFERTTRRVRLTESGERLLVQARLTLDAARRCTDVVRDAQAAPFELSIGTRYELGLSFLVPSLGVLEKARKERRIHLYFGDSADLLARVLRGDLDAAVTSARLNDSRMSYVPLHAEDYVFVGTRQLLARAPLSQAQHALQHTLIDTLPDLPLFRYLLDARPAHESWRFARSELLGTIAAVRARVLQGAGVAVLPKYFVREQLRNQRLVALLSRTKLATDWFRLVWRTGHPSEARLRELASQLASLPLR